MLPLSTVQSPADKVTPPAAPSVSPTSSQGTVSFANDQSPSLRCSSQANKGIWKSLRYAEEYSNPALNAAVLKPDANLTTPTDYVDQVFCTSISNPLHDFDTSQLAYPAELEANFDTGELHCTDPRAYLANTKKKKYDSDNSSYQDTLTGEYARKYEATMLKEIRQLIQQNTWQSISRSVLPVMKNGRHQCVLPGTWAFKLKQLPDGTPSRFKARYCVEGDLQTEGVDHFETYAPVVQWSVVRMLLTMVLSKNWVTEQVDYTNSFAQADLSETVFIKPPKAFSCQDKADCVLKLIKSL